jgi:hypothetical protein
MSMNSDPHGVVELSGWPDAAALIRWREEGPQLGEARVLLPPPPASYWHSTALQEDRHFDADARNRSVAFQRKYLEEFRQLERAPYPPHLVVMPHTGLPALLNDYLPDFALAEDRDKLGELVQQWLAQESLDLALFGVSPDQLFQPAGPESRRRLEYRGALQLGFPEVGDKAQSRSDSVQQRDTLHFHYQQFYAGKWPVYGGRVVVHCGFGDPRVSVSSSYFPLREDKPFDPRLTDVEARDIAMQVLRRYVGDRFKKKPIIAMVPYAGSAQFITAYRDHFCLAYRFEVTNELGDEAWRVFVDAESGLVLGPPEQLTAQARAYYFGSSAAARQLKQTFDPSLTLAQLKTGLDPYCSSLETVVGTVLDLTGFQDPPKLPPPVDEFEAANIAFHAWRTLAHFMTACGVASLQLEAYGYAYEVWEEAGLMEEKVTKTGTLSRPLRLVVGKADGDVLQMGFVSAEEINPKTIIFQTATEPPTFRVDGNLVPAEGDRQLVLTAVRFKPEERLDLPLVLAEHVVGLAQQMAVEAHLGQGVQPVAHQEDLLFGQERRVRAERAAVFPVAFGDPQDALLVVGHKRVGDTSQGQQVSVDAARRLPRQPFIASGLAELPGAGQRLDIHGFDPLL